MRIRRVKLCLLIVKKHCASTLYLTFYQMTFRITNLYSYDGSSFFFMLDCKCAWGIDLFSASVGLWKVLLIMTPLLLEMLDQIWVSTYCLLYSSNNNENWSLNVIHVTHLHWKRVTVVCLVLHISNGWIVWVVDSVLIKNGHNMTVHLIYSPYKIKNMYIHICTYIES